MVTGNLYWHKKVLYSRGELQTQALKPYISLYVIIINYLPTQRPKFSSTHKNIYTRNLQTNAFILLHKSLRIAELCMCVCVLHFLCCRSLGFTGTVKSLEVALRLGEGPRNVVKSPLQDPIDGSLEEPKNSRGYTPVIPNPDSINQQHANCWLSYLMGKMFVC